MGADVSRPSREYTELYLPADTFRRCNPPDCFCHGNHQSPRMMYVDRGMDGRERYHDPLDYYGPFMNGGALPSWKDPRSWTEQDYDRLKEVMTNLNDRVLGQQMRGWGGGGGMPGMPGMMWPGSFNPKRHMFVGESPWGSNMYDIAAQVQHIKRHYDRRFKRMNNVLFGSEEDHMRERLKQGRFKHMQEFLQTMNGGFGANGMGMNGMGVNGMGMNEMGTNGMGRNRMGMKGMEGMQMPMMMNQDMDPMMANVMRQKLAEMEGMHGMHGMGGGYGGYGGMPMNHMAHEMHPGGGWGGHMNGFGGGMGGGGFERRRPAFRRQSFGRPGMRNPGWSDDGLDDEMDMGWGGRGGFPRNPRRRDDGDFFDGGFGDGE